MEKGTGAEGYLGLGGGMVSAASQKSLEKAEDLCKKRKPKQAIPYLVDAIMESPVNLDAAIQCAYVSDREGAVEILEFAERTGQTTLKQVLGEDCFEDTSEHAGDFWFLIETRPYMRVLQALVRIYFEEGRYQESEKLMIEMLRLCHRDNTSQRTWLGSMLIRNSRYADALCFLQSWFDHESPPRGGIIFTRPSRSLLPSAREKDLSRWGDGNMLHDAALAAFKLFGDCPQSCQYLRMAAHAQPSILIKVLGLASRPEKLNLEPRAHNGPEDAHDYLWLAQDLWMQSDVWRWANRNPDVRNAILQYCDQCSARETEVAQFKRCSACRIVRYCSPQCQKKNWPIHKLDCKAHQEQKAQLRLFHKGKNFMGKNTMTTTPIRPSNLARRQHQRGIV